MAIAPNLEGLDFIETEEDVKAVESAALKIQSTFRGKKFRSKKPAAPEASASGVVNGGSISTSQVKNQPEVRGEEAAKKKLSSEEESELNKRVAGIQVNDNSNNNTSDSSSKMASSSSAAPEATTNNNAVASNLPEEEAERAATKIQAGFKGYKTRKELEGKLGGSGDSAGDGAAGGKAEVAPQDGEK